MQVAAGGVLSGVAGDELSLVAFHLMTQADVQEWIEYALDDANRVAGGDLLSTRKLMRRSPAHLKSASESEWFIRLTLRAAEDLTLLTRREKRILQRRPALLKIVRQYCLEGDGDSSLNWQGNSFERSERHRAEAIVNASRLQEQVRQALSRRAVSAKRERTLRILPRPNPSRSSRSHNVVDNDACMSLADSSGVTPLCNSLAS